MASLSEIRSGIAAVLGALPGWTESRYAPDHYGLDTSHLLHRSFSVEIGRTDLDLPHDRQRGGTAALTEIVVHWAFRLRGDAQVADWDSALDAESELVVALWADDVSQHCKLTEASRQTSGSGDFLLGAISLQALHLYALS